MHDDDPVRLCLRVRNAPWVLADWARHREPDQAGRSVRIAAGLALFARRLLFNETTLWTPPTLLLFAAAFVVAGEIVGFLDWRGLGFDPELSSQAALVRTFSGEEGLLNVICAIMALYVAGRTSRGLVTRPRNNSFDLVTLFTIYTALQGIATTIVTRRRGRRLKCAPGP